MLLCTTLAGGFETHRQAGSSFIEPPAPTLAAPEQTTNQIAHMNENATVRLSVVIPAYNDERRLPKTLDEVLGYLAKQDYRTEVVVADDGSTDGTARIVKERSSGPIPVRVVTHSDGRNHGKGAAVRLGMLDACGQFRLFMDADNSTTINHVERFWPFFEEGYDVVIGSRGMKDSLITVSQPWYRKIAGEGGNLI